MILAVNDGVDSIETFAIGIVFDMKMVLKAENDTDCDCDTDSKCYLSIEHKPLLRYCSRKLLKMWVKI